MIAPFPLRERELSSYLEEIFEEISIHRLTLR